MRYIVIYDIPVDFDKIRTKISDILLNYCMLRLNYSVFFGELSTNHAEEIALKLEKVMKKVPGDVRIIPICNSCCRKAIVVKSKFEEGFKFVKELFII
ncbi:MAG: CRISPR-associated endonuclease Cas2 [Promethearchaeota archaeon]